MISLILEEYTIIKNIDIITAIIITNNISVRPIAVKIESTEKTKSTATICQIIDLKLTEFVSFNFSSKFPFILWDISRTLLKIKNPPPKNKIKSLMLKFIKTGFVKPINQVKPNNMIILNTKARRRPITLALCLLFFSTLFVTIEMNIILSIPNIISMIVSVNNAM